MDRLNLVTSNNLKYFQIHLYDEELDSRKYKDVSCLMTPFSVEASKEVCKTLQSGVEILKKTNEKSLNTIQVCISDEEIKYLQKIFIFTIVLETNNGSLCSFFPRLFIITDAILEDIIKYDKEDVKSLL